MPLFRAKRVRCLVSLSHNGSGVFGAMRLFLASMSCVKALRSTLKAMSFQGLHWLQKLGSCKASFGAKMVQYRQVRSRPDQHSYDTLLNSFPKPWYLEQPREILKCETILTLNLIKNNQVSKRKCNKTTFLKEMYYVNNGDALCPLKK